MTLQSTLRVVSNFGHGDSVVGEIHTRAKFQGDARAPEFRQNRQN